MTTTRQQAETEGLTRDELRRACERLPGWECHENHAADEEGNLAFWVTVGKASEPGYHELFQTFAGEEVYGDYDDAVRILEATGEDYEIQRHRSGFSVGFVGLDWLEHDPDLSTAAVRAINEAEQELTSTRQHSDSIGHGATEPPGGIGLTYGKESP